MFLCGRKRTQTLCSPCHSLFLIWMPGWARPALCFVTLLVWLYIDFPACSPSHIVLSLSFNDLTLKVKLLVPLFRCPVLFSATIKCGCSMRIELLQRKQVQECPRQRCAWEGRGEQGTGTWLQVLAAPCFPQRPAVFATLFRCHFYKPVVLLPPN